MKIIDITVPICPDTPTWPGSHEFNLHWSKRLDDGDECNNSHIECDTHTGTHVDAPFHFLKSGATVEKLSLDILIGPAIVAYFPEVNKITADVLKNLEVPAGTQRLLLRTRNSELWAKEITHFKKNFVSLTPDAAHWIVNHGIRLIGIDYLSVGSYEDGIMTHRILLEAGVIILETLNLYNTEAGEYELICLPLKVLGAEGAPARAVLIK